VGITACSRGMSQKPSPAQKKALLVKLAVVAVAGLVGAVLVLRGLDVKALFNDTLALVRQVGPEAFFAGMAILPALGFPMSPFWLSAGPVFTPVLGLPLVIGLCAVSLAVNLAFTYWLARYAFRPPLVWLVRRLGYELPHVAVADQVEVTVLLRVTPGPPFFIQGYLLGLAEIPFKTYLLVSWPISMAYGVAFIFFGDSLACQLLRAQTAKAAGFPNQSLSRRTMACIEARTIYGRSSSHLVLPLRLRPGGSGGSKDCRPAQALRRRHGL
jgi:uncharacterized membrane protein YdjX (TVP38/TMEM64 family)